MSCIYMLLLLSGLICLFFTKSVDGGSLRPKISVMPRTGEVIQAQNFTITCFTLYPGGTFFLEFNGSNITKTPDSVLSNSSSFVFKAVDSSFSGNYTCVYVTTGPTGKYNFSRSGVVVVHVTISDLMLIVAGSVGGAVFLLLLILLCVFLTRKLKTHREAVVFSIYQSQPVEREDLDSEPDYMETPSVSRRASNTNMEMQGFGKGCSYVDTPSEGSQASYVNVEIPEEEESAYEEDYVNTETMETCNVPVGDSNSDSEPDYENSVFLFSTAK